MAFEVRETVVMDGETHDITWTRDQQTDILDCYCSICTRRNLWFCSAGRLRSPPPTLAPPSTQTWRISISISASVTNDNDDQDDDGEDDGDDDGNADGDDDGGDDDAKNRESVIAPPGGATTNMR